MTIQEVKEKRTALEADLVRLISDFEQQTGTWVSDIKFEPGCIKEQFIETAEYGETKIGEEVIKPQMMVVVNL